jgi:hypothetical protein
MPATQRSVSCRLQVREYICTARWSRTSHEHLIGQASPYASAAPSGDQFNAPEDRFWNLYLTQAEKVDKKLTESWKGDADGILIFVRRQSLSLWLHVTQSHL